MKPSNITRMGRWLLSEGCRNGGVLPEYPKGSPRHADIGRLVRDGFAERTLTGVLVTEAGRRKLVPRAKRRVASYA